MILEVTTVLAVEAIEPLLDGWARLGFRPVAEVPHGDRLGFVILTNEGGLRIMLQTRESLEADIGLVPPLVLYAKVRSLEEAAAAAEGMEVLIDRRTTFYGATERWVRDPSGTVIGLAVGPS